MTDDIHQFCSKCERKICIAGALDFQHITHARGEQLKSGYYCYTCSDTKTGRKQENAW